MLIHRRQIDSTPDTSCLTDGNSGRKHTKKKIVIQIYKIFVFFKYAKFHLENIKMIECNPLKALK